MADHFTCPRCGAQHSRGALNGVDVYRCLRCGYVGHGYHADYEIDLDIARDAAEAEAFDVAAGLAPWGGIPREPPEHGEFRA
jgi:rubredoxin